MAEVGRCCICEADFRVSALKDGKCPLCLEQHPDEKSRDEVLSKVKIPNKMGDEIDELRVREIVGEMLDSRLNPVVEKLDQALKVEAAPVKRGPGRPKKTESEAK